MKTELTIQQKLDALAMKYYDNFKWEPKAGDYYTTSRSDIELYKITREDDKYFYTIYCNIENCREECWEKEKFLQDFGINRVFVHPIILK